MNATLLDRYRALPDELEELGAEIADITERWVGEQDDDAVARDVERAAAAARPFPPALVPWLPLAGIGVHWIVPGKPPVGGELHLADFVAQWLGPALQTDVRDRADGGDVAAVLADACWFDTHPSSGDGAETILDRATGRLWFQKQGTLFPMLVDPAGYIERLIESRGVGNWQYCFAEVPRTYFDHAYVAGRTRDALANLERIFPDTDWSEWRAAVAARS